MEDIYIFAIVFAVLAVYFGIMFICWRYNPLWRREQLRNLKEGHVRTSNPANLGDGHTLYVVKKIDKERRVIICDTYVLVKGKYVLDIVDREESYADFFKHTDAEPVRKEERV